MVTRDTLSMPLVYIKLHQHVYILDSLPCGRVLTNSSELALNQPLSEIDMEVMYNSSIKWMESRGCVLGYKSNLSL